LSYNDEEYLFHLEFQLQHKSDFPKRIFIYSAELTDLFQIPVISLVLYLERRKSPLPDSYTVCLGDKVVNRFSYQVLKLWEYTKEIRAGKFPALAPLLSMLVEEPTEETLIEERELILQEKDERRRANYTGVDGSKMATRTAGRTTRRLHASVQGRHSFNPGK